MRLITAAFAFAFAVTVLAVTPEECKRNPKLPGCEQVKK